MRFAPSGEQMCDTCERLVAPAEQGQCAFCRMSMRGDTKLICHNGDGLDAGSWLDAFMARCRQAAQ